MELLAPAGGPEQLQMAVHFGADAVYLSAPRWGMRSGCRNFSPDELDQAVAYAHGHGVRVYLAANTLMRDDDIDDLADFFANADEMGVDALIVSELGAISVARTIARHTDIHLSTQASCMNYRAVDEYARLGVSRVVLAREMTLEQIAKLRARCTSAIELEAFAHGSACMAYSGRCLLSAELMGSRRTPSSGSCAQPCRWGWSLVEDRTGQAVPLETDERGSYLLSSNDVNMISHLDELEGAGVSSVKIEGRAKGSYYVACVTNAYRHVLDGTDVDPWAAELELVSHRPYSAGFYLGNPTQNPGRVDYARERRLVGVVEGCAPAPGGGWVAEVECRNRAEAGSVVQVLSPGESVRDVTLEEALVTNGGSYAVRLPFEVAPLDVLCQ